VISAISAEGIVFLLSKKLLLFGLAKEQLFFLKVIIFIGNVAIAYFVISFLFRDLYVM
jgi:hypothetical protein